jgi:hypothetical protein
MNGIEMGINSEVKNRVPHTYINTHLSYPMYYYVVGIQMPGNGTNLMYML